MNFTEYTVFYRSEWASRADSIVFYSVFTRPEGQENDGQCGQNLRKTMIFDNFFVSCRKMLRGGFGRSKAPKLGRKSGSEALKIGRQKGIQNEEPWKLASSPKNAPKGKPDRTRTGSAVLSAY